MTPKMLFTTAFRALHYHAIRTLLTMLGIIIGIAALICTMAIGRGAQKKIEAEIAALGSNSVVVWAGTVGGSKGKMARKSTRPPTPIKVRDALALKKQLTLIKHIAPMCDLPKAVASRGQINIESKLKGSNEHYLSISNRTLKAGRNLNKEDTQLRRRVVLLGSEAAQLLFKTENPIGQSIIIQKKKFTIVGVINSVTSSNPFDNPNLDIIAPLPTVQRRILKRPTNQVDYLFISCLDEPSLPTLVRQITNIMRIRHHLKQNDSNDFTVFDQLSYGKARARSSDILSILLMLVASISLLVGGIGVMNIMLVSVSERTREIGIRMALGATGWMILVQFIIEAIVVCFIGGLIGIAIGVSTPLMIAHFTNWPIVITPISIAVACIVTTLVGIFFGIYPAYQASQLRPVEALQEQ